MPSLGVGRSTPFSQPSNHHTIYNHCFRETSSYDVSRQSKVKCSYCGVWATKGTYCNLCGTFAKSVRYDRAKSPPATARRPSEAASPGTSRREVVTPKPAATTTPHRQATTPRSPAAGRGAQQSPSANQKKEQFAQKVKCSYCGVWVVPGRYCSLCRTPS
jgi:hypothetical protein